MTLLDTALAYHRAGLVVLPNDAALKYPPMKGWERMPVTEADVRRWFGKASQTAIGVRDREGIDIDNKGSPNADALYRAWFALVEQQAPGLVDRLLCEQTPSGGFHLVWRCEVIAGSQELAVRPPTEEEQERDPNKTSVTLIETRGKGGQFQVAPSPGYTLLRGSWTALPEISAEERIILLDCARALTKADRRTHTQLQKPTGERAGDRYNQEGDGEALDLLERAGWVVAYEHDGAKYLTRPDKRKGVSATFGYVAPGVLYVFSSNASPFQSRKAYTPFAIYTELKHNGDYKAAARTLHQRYNIQQTRTVIDVSTGELIAVPDRTMAIAEPVRLPSKPIDFYDLLATPREPIRWYAPGFVREGLGILAGEANVGKTPLAVQLAIAFACGGLWMNKVQCRQAKTLFIGTEYTQDELAYVVEKSAAGMQPPKDMLTFKSLSPDNPEADREIQPESPAEALTLLDYYFRVEGYQAIFIDVFTGFLPDEPFKQNIYRGDYKEFKPYHVLALRYHAALLGTWHTVKRESTPRYMFNGSSGFWGVPASRVTLYSDQENRIRLFSMPRFEKKTDWALTQEQTLAGLRWVVSDAAPEPMMSDLERTIYRWLKENADRANPRSPQTIADMTSLPVPSVKTTLRRMLDKNLVDQSKAGSGYFVDVTDVTFDTDVTHVTSVTETFDTVGNTTLEKGNIDLLHTNGLNSPGNKSNTVTSVTGSNNSEMFARLKDRVLSDAELNDILTKDNPDTTFTSLSGTPIEDEENDHAIEG